MAKVINSNKLTKKQYKEFSLKQYGTFKKDQKVKVKFKNKIIEN